MSRIKINELKKLAQKYGLLLVGFTTAAELLSDRERLQKWCADGYAADMQYMKRSAELLSDPHRLLGEASTVVCFAVNYDRVAVPPPPKGFGRVARYAFGEDYHNVLPKRVKGLLDEIQRGLGIEIRSRIFSDAVPLLERALARRAGLGFIGKNSMLIRPGSGSFFLLAEILWDLEIEGQGLGIVEESCGTCSRCRTACPTQAIVNDYTVDSRRCISYLTIEKRGVFSAWERNAIGNWLFGCDICQEVCPFNHRALKEGAPSELSAGVRNGPYLNLEEVISIRSDDQFRNRFRNSAILRAKREGLIRNAINVAVNTGVSELLSTIEDALNDCSEVVKEEARNALELLS